MIAASPALEILQPGMLTTVQDTGRYGYQRFGMPVAGAMDGFALRAANRLVGNADRAAGLEITALGPQIRLLDDVCLAIAGAAVAPLLDGEAVPMWQPVIAPAGGLLAFQAPRDGLRAYLAVAGGVAVPAVMGSRSTYIKAGIGGHEGRALAAGDALSAYEPAGALSARRRMPEGGIPAYGGKAELRVVLGPQNAAFTRQGIRTFLTGEYAVSIHSDRMGYRLEGPAIEHRAGADIISDGAPMGAVQVPGDGKPIILLADRGTTGGYTKIAAVITADLDKVAQAMPGGAFTFRAVSLDEARAALREREAILDAIKAPARLAIVSDGAVSDILDSGGDPITLASAAPIAPMLRRRRGRAHIGGEEFEIEIAIRRANKDAD